MNDINKIINRGIFPNVERPPFCMAEITIGSSPVKLPPNTYRLFVGDGGDLNAKLAGDTGYSLMKNIPDAEVIEGMFDSIHNDDTTADDIVAFYIPFQPEGISYDDTDGTELDVSATTGTANSTEIDVTVQLKDRNGDNLPYPGVKVNFATTFGNLNSDYTFTDATGEAKVVLTATTNGEAKLTATVEAFGKTNVVENIGDDTVTFTM